MEPEPNEPSLGDGAVEAPPTSLLDPRQAPLPASLPAIRVALVRGAVQGGLVLLLCALAPQVPPSGAVFALQFGLLAAALAWYEGRLAHRGVGVLGGMLRVAGLSAVGAVVAAAQAAYVMTLIKDGSPAKALAAGLDISQWRGVSWAFVPLITAPHAVQAAIRLWSAPAAQKVRRGAWGILLALPAFLSLAIDGFSVLQPRGIVAVFVLHTAVAFASVPAIGWLSGSGTERAPASLPMKGRLRGALIFFGVVFPWVCVGINEALSLGVNKGLFHPEWAAPGAWTWWNLCYDAAVQRPLLVPLAWGQWALLSAINGRRSALIRVGLIGGVVVTGFFGLLFLHKLYVFLFGLIVFGAGLLGLSPYFALATFLEVFRRYECSAVAAAATQPPRERVRAFTATFTALTSLATWQASRALIQLYAELPQSPPPDCYLATVSARGNPRVTGAWKVRFADGSVRPLTQQLRVFKAGELLLKALSPSVHSTLRRSYDRWGPGLANRLGPRACTACYVLLLPAQALVALVLRCVLKDPAAFVRLVYPPPAPSAPLSLRGWPYSSRPVPDSSGPGSSEPASPGTV